MKKISLKSKLGIIKKVLFKKGNPVYLIHFITNRCNANCNFCFYYTNLNKNNANELRLDEIDKLTQKYGKLYQVILTGGEPFLRTDLLEIAKLYYKNCDIEQLAIPTNAILTDVIEKKTKEILKNLDNVSVNINLSLNGIGKDHDSILHVRGAFAQFIETYKRLVKLKKIYPNLGIQVTSTLSKLTEKEFLKIYKYSLKNFPCAVFQPNLIRGNLKISKKVDMRVYKEINEGMKNNIQFRENISSGKLSAAKNLARNDLIINTVEKNKFLTPCYAGSLIGVLYENGDVYPCELLKKRVGNIRDFNYDFSKLWRSNKNKEIIKFIKNTKCFCTHECFYTVNMLFNPKHYPKIMSKFIQTRYKQV